jgi:hypothetical protein
MINRLSVLGGVAAVMLAAMSNAQGDATQYWHERYHGILSMAAYGDYTTLCPQFFTQQSLLKSYPNSVELPWTLLSNWGPTASGLTGFNVMIPEMDKVIMVFGGLYGWENLNMTATPITALNVGNCDGCTAHAGALKAYLEAKEATNDWEVVKQYVTSTGHQWSITGHGFGGMVAQIAALDLGWRGLSHWSHSHGAPRVFNPAAAARYNSLYQGEASQRTVANQDSVPGTIPESADYTMTLSGFHVFGTNVTYGMNYANCFTSATDPECLGGNNRTDHDFYYTEIGTCGGGRSLDYNATAQDAFIASQSSAYYATAVLPTTTSSSVVRSSTVSSVVPTTTSVSSAAPSASAGAGATGRQGSGAGKVGAGVGAVAGLVAAVMALVA